MKTKFTAVLLIFFFGFNALAVEKSKLKSTAKKSQTKASSKKKTENNKPKSQPKPERDTGPQVKKFEFVGIKRTPQEELKKISAKYIQNQLYGPWTDKMIQDIQSIPIVREAHLIRDMTGNITFEITEREPVAYLYLDKYYWMDEQAKAIQVISSNTLENNIFFSGPWKSPSDYEKKNGPVIVAEGIRFYSQLLANDFPEKKISEVHFDVNLGWIMYRVGSRAPVVFGTQNLPAKIERFVEVVPQITPMETIISRIDADFNDRVVVKLQDQEVKK